MSKINFPLYKKEWIHKRNGKHFQRVKFPKWYLLSVDEVCSIIISIKVLFHSTHGGMEYMR